MIWHFSPLGDTALLAQAPAGDPRANQVALALARQLEAAPPPGFVAAVPAIDTLLICYEPLLSDYAALSGHLRGLLAGPLPASAGQGQLVEVPVRYGGAHGPDLEAVAAQLGLSPAEVVALHCGQPLPVLMLGFAPGYAYLGGLPAALHLPRRASPRSAVPAGSVAIAAGMTGIYPARLPGGWHLIGQTDMTLFDPAAEPPALLRPGDNVRFVAA
jgi:KipI family sensor histidine kinase inhibitor